MSTLTETLKTLYVSNECALGKDCPSGLEDASFYSEVSDYLENDANHEGIQFYSLLGIS